MKGRMIVAETLINLRESGIQTAFTGYWREATKTKDGIVTSGYRGVRHRERQRHDAHTGDTVGGNRDEGSELRN